MDGVPRTLTSKYTESSAESTDDPHPAGISPALEITCAVLSPLVSATIVGTWLESICASVGDVARIDTNHRFPEQEPRIR